LGRRGTTFGTYPEQPVRARGEARIGEKAQPVACLWSAVQAAFFSAKQQPFQDAVHPELQLEV
tara:strand:- start:74 stop:262 length:189 start_codon:yes stop_codon:yes gene_type:complete